MKILGIVHNILASLLKWLLAPLMYVINSVFALCKGEINTYNDHLAYAKDLYGNILMQYVMNLCFLNKASTYLYGTVKDNIYVTVSHITAFNYYAGTMTKFGKLFAWILIQCSDKSFKQEDIDNNIINKLTK